MQNNTNAANVQLKSTECAAGVQRRNSSITERVVIKFWSDSTKEMYLSTWVTFAFLNAEQRIRKARSEFPQQKALAEFCKLADLQSEVLTWRANESIAKAEKADLFDAFKAQGWKMLGNRGSGGACKTLTIVVEEYKPAGAVAQSTEVAVESTEVAVESTEVAVKSTGKRRAAAEKA